MRPESAVTNFDASVSGGADAVSVEESPHANLKGGLANPKPGLPACLSKPSAISLFNGTGGAFRAADVSDGAV